MPGVVGAALLLLAVAAVAKGEAPEPLRFFTCATVQFFAERCAPAEVPVEAALASTEVSSPVSAPETPVPDTTPEAPEKSEPLFPPQTLAPDTPPLLFKLLHEPTEAHAKAYLAWQRARMQRIDVVQTLLRRLQEAELERNRQAASHP